MDSKTDADAAPVDRIVMTLEPGHYRAIIQRMEAYLNDQRRELVGMVESKDFDGAYKCAVEILEVEFWIANFEDELLEYESE